MTVGTLSAPYISESTQWLQKRRQREIWAYFVFHKQNQRCWWVAQRSSFAVLPANQNLHWRYNNTSFQHIAREVFSFQHLFQPLLGLLWIMHQSLKEHDFCVPQLVYHCKRAAHGASWKQGAGFFFALFTGLLFRGNKAPFDPIFFH